MRERHAIARIAFVAASLAACAGPRGTQPQPEGAGKRIVGYYFAPTVRRGFPVSRIDAARLTHVNYAFANISPEGVAILGDPCFDVGECAAGRTNPHSRPGGNFAELRRLKAQHPHLRTLISIGGWGWSQYFSDVAATEEGRQRFVSSTIDLFLRQHAGAFDGVDLDWEYPVRGGRPENRHRPEDRENFTLLLRDFRRALDEQGGRDGKRYLLTVALAAAPGRIRDLEVPRLAEVLDFVNLMTYDYHTGGRVAHFNAPLDSASGDPTPRFTVRASVAAYIEEGLPAAKLVLGVPFYGYGYGGVGAERDGLFQTAERTDLEVPDSARTSPWIGSVRFHRIAQALREGFVRHWESQAAVPWLYDAQRRIWITYDDAESLALKAELVREQSLGGVMIWELSGDDGTLLPMLNARLRR